MLGKNKNLSPPEALGIVLRELRKKAGYSQEKLAFEAGIERNYVSLIELGRNQPTISVLFKLSNALEIKPSKFVLLVESRCLDALGQS